MKKNVVIAGSIIVLCGFLAVFIILYSAKIEKQEEDISKNYFMELLKILIKLST